MSKPLKLETCFATLRLFKTCECASSTSTGKRGAPRLTLGLQTSRALRQLLLSTHHSPNCVCGARLCTRTSPWVCWWTNKLVRPRSDATTKPASLEPTPGSLVGDDGELVFDAVDYYRVYKFSLQKPHHRDDLPLLPDGNKYPAHVMDGNQTVTFHSCAVCLF